MQTGQYISILLGHATAHCAIGTTHAHGTVVGTTEKAVCVKLDSEGFRFQRSVWFPRKALIQKGPEGEGRYHMAHWFRPDGRTAEALKACSHHSALVA